jgi:hypothetical protein
MTDLLSGTWLPLPGPLELVERTDPGEALADPAGVLGGTRGVRLGTDKQAWRRLLDRLRGLRREEVLQDATPSWIDLVELHVPPAGRAELRSNRSSNRTTKPELKLFGFGFGSGMTVDLAEKVTFDARQVGKVLQVRMLLTAVRYVDGDGASVVRVDLGGPASGVDQRVIDLPAEREQAFNRARWTLLQRTDLSGLAEQGRYSWSYTAGRRAKWTVGFQLGGIAGIPLGANLQAEVEGSEEFETSFEVPYGHDVIFYRRTGETPLTPRCATTPSDF